MFTAPWHDHATRYVRILMFTPKPCLFVLRLCYRVGIYTRARTRSSHSAARGLECDERKRAERAHLQRGLGGRADASGHRLLCGVRCCHGVAAPACLCHLSPLLVRMMHLSTLSRDILRALHILRDHVWRTFMPTYPSIASPPPNFAPRQAHHTRP